MDNEFQTIFTNIHLIAILTLSFWFISLPFVYS